MSDARRSPEHDERELRAWQLREAEKAYRIQVKAIDDELGHAMTIAAKRRAEVAEAYQQEMYRIATAKVQWMEFRASVATYNVQIGDAAGERWKIDHDIRLITISPNVRGSYRSDILLSALVAAAIYHNPGKYSVDEMRAIEKQMRKTMEEDMQRQGGVIRLNQLRQITRKES